MKFCCLKLSIVVALAAWLVTTSLIRCSDEDQTFQTTPFRFPVLPDFPSIINIPGENPMTIEGVELGRFLFYDGRLSGRLEKDSLMSCATCHIQSNGFECGDRFPSGHPRGLPIPGYPDGKPTPHVMLPVVNLVYNTSGYMWSGFLQEENNLTQLPGYDLSQVDDLNFHNLETFTYMAIVAQHEMNGSLAKTEQAVRSDRIYPPMFRNAFGTEDITIEKISMAISQFIRSIISYRSKYHQWLRGEAQLSEGELRGYELYFSETADCFHCHGGTALLTTFDYYNNGKDSIFTDPRDRYSVSGNVWDKGAYRAPSLVNVEYNGPYMHDGRFQTLDEVIDFYSEDVILSSSIHPLMKYAAQGGVHLTSSQKQDLKAFLLCFTDHELATDPAYSAPAELQEWLGK